jgi:hypothetical protein
LKGTDVTSNGRTVQATPIDHLRAMLKKYGRGAPPSRLSCAVRSGSRPLLVC